jgi:hypothetical protein
MANVSSVFVCLRALTFDNTSLKLDTWDLPMYKPFIEQFKKASYDVDGEYSGEGTFSVWGRWKYSEGLQWDEVHTYLNTLREISLENKLLIKKLEVYYYDSDEKIFIGKVVFNVKDHTYDILEIPYSFEEFTQDFIANPNDLRRDEDDPANWKDTFDLNQDLFDGIGINIAKNARSQHNLAGGFYRNKIVRPEEIQL